MVGLQSATGPEAGVAVLCRALRPGRGVALRAQGVPRGGGERALEVPERPGVHVQARHHREVSQPYTAPEPYKCYPNTGVNKRLEFFGFHENKDGSLFSLIN